MASPVTTSSSSPTSPPAAAWHPDQQTVRRQKLAAIIRTRLRPLLQPDAAAPNLLWWDQDRLAIHASNAFFLGDPDDIAFANTILRYVRDRLTGEPEPNCFTASGLTSILCRHGDKLDADVRAFCLDRLRVLLPLGMTRDYQFHGYNDNMPCMWTWALARGAVTFNEPRYARIAWANLRQLADLFNRRGIQSEFGQLYTAHQIAPVADLAEHAPDPAMRALALDLEARFWAGWAGFWHPNTATVAGPAMRGVIPFNREVSAFMHQVFGQAINLPAPRWTEYLDHAPEAFTRELGADPRQYTFCYPLCYSAEFASATYHVPEVVVPLFLGRDRDVTFQATAELGHYNAGVFCKQIPVYGQGGVFLMNRLTSEEVEIQHHPVFGATNVGIMVYHANNFALGTSTTAMFGTSHALRCTYRRHDSLRDERGYGEVFTRYVINDKTPGGRRRNTYYQSPDHPQEMENYCTLTHDQAFVQTLQHGPTALCVQTPMWTEYWDIRQLRSDVYFYRRPPRDWRIWIGGERVTTLPFESQTTGTLTLDEGAVYLAVHPLIGRAGPRRVAIRLWEIDDYLVLSLFNYEGPSQSLTPRQIAKLGNGFVLEARDADRYPSFGAFQEEMAQVRLIDQLYAGVRRVSYFRGNDRLTLWVCPYQNTVMQRSINGQTQVIEQLSLPGDVQKELPLLGGRPADVDADADYEWIRMQTDRPAETHNVVD